MEIFHEFTPNLLQSSAIALGFFDGVHLGHQAVIKMAINEAKSQGITPAIVTFKDHPRVLTRGNSPLLLTLIEQRLAIFEGLGIEAVLALTFTEALCRLSAQEYVQTVLVNGMGAKSISVGFNHHFGRQREGDPQLLAQYGKSLRFTVNVAKPVFFDNIEVSSSKIRECLENTNLDLANKLLSRPFSLLGKVKKGDGRGSQLGFPTANLEISSLQMLPAYGVYAAKVTLAKESITRPAVVNIGVRPTIDANATHPLAEVHLLDFKGDLYDQNIEVHFYKYLRPEKKFSNLEALKAQIQIDCQAANNSLSSVFSH